MTLGDKRRFAIADIVFHNLRSGFDNYAVVLLRRSLFAVIVIDCD